MRLPLRILAATLAVAAQLLLAAASVGEARFGADAGPHVEIAGIHLHHAHDEASCIACISQHLLSSSEPGKASSFTLAASLSSPQTVGLSWDHRAPQYSSKPRAPPV